MIAPLLGHNLVRLTYLDEAGSDYGAPFLAVAGVVVHGDFEWPEINKRIAVLIENYIPESDRAGFFFHATDIFHGSGYFDRRKTEWTDREKRWQILLDIARIIEDLSLPVVAGTYRKATFGGELIKAESAAFQHKMIHDMAVLDCMLWADRWLAKFAPSELSTIIHEDGTAAKPLIKATIRIMRSDELMRQWGFDPVVAAEFGLPLKRIIDTVHFAEKADARPLQLADLCAFILGRAMKNLAVPIGVFQILFKQVQWIMTIQGVGDEAKKALDALTPTAADVAE
jgi:Protein of unknown function (DUF3800)